MRDLRVIFASILFLGLLTACEPASPAVPVSQTVTPNPTRESPGTQPSSPLLTPEETDMTSPLSLDENAQKLVALVKAHLAQQLGIPVEQITLVEVKPTMWRDASLGCPKPAIDYIPMETPGYSIILEAGGQSYPYHTDQVNRFVQCNRP